MIFYKNEILDEFYTLNDSDYQNKTRGGPMGPKSMVDRRESVSNNWRIENNTKVFIILYSQ